MKYLITVLLIFGYAIQPLYINTVTWVGEKSTDVVTEVKEVYFEIGLYSKTMKDGSKTYNAHRDLEKSEPGQPYRRKMLFISDSKGIATQFASATEFLNYMDTCGYSLVSQKEAKYVTDYTFKKK